MNDLEQSLLVIETAKHYPGPIPLDDNNQPDHRLHAQRAADWAWWIVGESVDIICASTLDVALSRVDDESYDYTDPVVPQSESELIEDAKSLMRVRDFLNALQGESGIYPSDVDRLCAIAHGNRTVPARPEHAFDPEKDGNSEARVKRKKYRDHPTGAGL